ncbi:MAG: type II toxin-antitoxin system HicB family antitoxin [Patulibacter sp.]
MSATYTVIVERPSAGESWSAMCPDLSVFATGDSRDHVVAQIREAIDFHLEVLREDGLPIPEPSSSVVQVTVAA